MMSSSGGTSKPQLPPKPVAAPPVPLRTNKPQLQTQVNNVANELDTEYPMNATWLFHPPGSGGGVSRGEEKPRNEWIKERAKAAAAVDLPPKLCLKSVPVLPVKPQSNVTASKSPPLGPGTRKDEGGNPLDSAPIKRDLNFTNEIKSRCIQRLTERLPPQVHYNANNVSINEDLLRLIGNFP